MSGILKIGLTALFVVLAASKVSAQNGPTIIGDQTREECQVALDIATRAFISTNPTLYWPVLAPDGPENKIVIARKHKDISGSDRLLVDLSVFERVERSTGSHTSLFWQKHPLDGKRIVVVDQPHSWAGSMFSLFNVTVGLSKEAFFQEFLSNKSTMVSLLRDKWNPPLVLLNTRSGAIWAIYPGPSAASLPQWRVLATSSEGMTSPCQIEFAQDLTPGVARLPPQVRRFASLANEALGPGKELGTYQATGRMRNSVNRGWAIVSERPWALTEAVYNSRKEVDLGLKDWARNNPVRKHLYLELQDTHKSGVQELAHYYINQFALKENDALRFSAYAMDHMLRRHFVFHRRNYRERIPTETPWPKDVR